MDFEEWADSDRRKGEECIAKTLDKLAKGKKIDILGDLIPELNHLKGKSYAGLHPSTKIDVCEKAPGNNLGFLLGSGLYEKVIVPLDVSSNKKDFEIAYGLSENRGCYLNFEQFLRLIKDEKLIIALSSSPADYRAEFYQDIFRQCDELPCFAGFRIDGFLYLVKTAQLAIQEKIKPKKGTIEEVMKLYPQYDHHKCIDEVENVFGEHLDEIGRTQHYPKRRYTSQLLGSRLWNLRIFGFEGLSEVVLRCAHLDRALGSILLSGYYKYLTAPVSAGILAFENYTLDDVLIMSFLKLAPQKLKSVWKDVLSSSPASFSVASPQTDLRTIRLKGAELLKLIEDFADDKNTKALRQEVVDVNNALNEFDARVALQKFRKVDEIITESVNSEIKSYGMKGRVSSHLLRLGKTFTAWTARALTMFSGFMAASGRFDWMNAALLGTGASLWARERLDEINANDIVRWWSKTWPFEDPGIGFIMWEKAH